MSSSGREAARVYITFLPPALFWQKNGDQPFLLGVITHFYVGHHLGVVHQLADGHQLDNVHQLDDVNHFRVVYEYTAVHLFDAAHHFVVINCTILSPFFLYFASKWISAPLWQEDGLLAQLSSWNNIKKRDDSEGTTRII